MEKETNEKETNGDLSSLSLALTTLAVPLILGLGPSIVSGFAELRKSMRDKELESDQWKGLEKEYFDHLKWRFDYPKRIFRQRGISGWVITFLVFALVVSGIVFSAIQLHSAIILRDFSGLDTEVAAEAGKVSISSSIVGAIVLVISIVFFYLYLKNVFQIQYPEPPHVGFKETDINALLNASLTSESKDAKKRALSEMLMKHLQAGKTDNKTKSEGETTA